MQPEPINLQHNSPQLPAMHLSELGFSLLRAEASVSATSLSQSRAWNSQPPAANPPSSCDNQHRFQPDTSPPQPRSQTPADPKVSRRRGQWATSKARCRRIVHPQKALELLKRYLNNEPQIAVRHACILDALLVILRRELNMVQDESTRLRLRNLMEVTMRVLDERERAKENRRGAKER